MLCSQFVYKKLSRLTVPVGRYRVPYLYDNLSRDTRPPQVKYRVGQVVKHNRLVFNFYHYGLRYLGTGTVLTGYLYRFGTALTYLPYNLIYALVLSYLPYPYRTYYRYQATYSLLKDARETHK